MAFDPRALSLAVDTIAGGSLRIHFYETTDSEVVVTGAGYFDGATARGLRVGEAIVVYDSNVGDTYVVKVVSVDGSGAATVEMESYELRKMTAAALAAYTGKSGEVTVNITDDTIHVHDGSTAGGFKLQHEIKIKNAADTAAYTGSSGEITVNSDDDTIHVHDGSTAGGFALQQEILKKTSAETAAFTGEDGQVTINTTDDTLHVHDGATAGGIRTARDDIIVPWVSTRTALKALSTARYARAYLDDGNRSGMFRRAAYADYTALITADTHNIIAARSTFDTDYVWLRVGARTDASELHVDWARDNPDVVHAITGVPGIAYAWRRCVDFATTMGVCGSIGASGCTIWLPPGENAWEGREGTSVPPRIPSNVTMKGHRGSTILKATSVYGIAAGLATPPFTPDTTYGYENIYIEDIIWDDTDRPFKYWLSQADGTTIADPEEDYRMGTGALASGISGVSLTATMSGGEITGVTVNTGGSGFKGNASFPYLPNEVPLIFEGGSPTAHHAYGRGIITAGSISSCIVDYAGKGYQSTPTVTTAGGWADITYLLDPAVDRRNALGYNQTQDACISIGFINRGAIRNCVFKGCSRTIVLSGCKDFDITGNKFIECGKGDGLFPVIYQTDHVTGPTRTRSEGIRVKNNSAHDCKRHFATMGQGGHGELIDNFVDGCALFAVGTDGQKWSGKLLVKGNVTKNVTYTNYTAQMCEIVDAVNIEMIDNVWENGDGPAISMSVPKGAHLQGNIYRNLFRDEPDNKIKFTPETERYAEGPGTMPKVFSLTPPTSPHAISISSNVADGPNNVLIENETVFDSRSTLPINVMLFTRTGTTSANSCKNIVIRNIKRLNPTTFGVNTAIDILGLSVPLAKPDIFDTKMSLWVYDNPEHVSMGAKALNYTFPASTTGNVTFDVGFPPKMIRAVVSGSAGAGQLSDVTLAWSYPVATGGDRLGATISHGDAANQQYFLPLTNRVLRVLDGATATELFAATFVAWTTNGFTLNVVTSPAYTITGYFLCFPK